jgi:hypothetical protein
MQGLQGREFRAAGPPGLAWTHKSRSQTVIKPLSIALAVSLAVAGSAALAGDPSGSMTGTQMQNCIAKEKAKNDGRSDADISSACTAKLQKQQGQSSGNSTNGMTPGSGTSPSATTPATPDYPTTTTPNDSNQTPK